MATGLATDRPALFFAEEPDLTTAAFREVLVASGLSRMRPVDDEARLAAMLAGADIVLTARLDRPGGALVGVVRAVTDRAWVCYVSELAVANRTQGHGVGARLMEELRRRLGPQVAITLASVPEAAGFYDRIGMERLKIGFWWPRSA